MGNRRDSVERHRQVYLRSKRRVAGRGAGVGAHRRGRPRLSGCRSRAKRWDQCRAFLLHPFNVPTCSGQSCWANGCEFFALEDSIGYAVLALHDWDDDRDTEVAFDAWARLSMARSTSRVLVLEDNGKQLRHLAATLSLDIVGVKDADTDQRPDFLLRFSSGVQVAESGQGWVSAEEFNLLAHTLPKGRVSVVDEVARSFAAAQCANIARTDVYDEQSLLCAKLRGVSYGVALDAFRKACENATTGGCSIEPALVWDAWRLPFTL